jgi:hypothetical protein
MTVALSTFCEHLAVRRVQRGKQRGGSVASIIVGHSFDITQSQRQHRLGAFQRLNSALFIHAQKPAFSAGFKIQPYNIPYLFCKKWIARGLFSAIIRTYPGKQILRAARKAKVEYEALPSQSLAQIKLKRSPCRVRAVAE